MSEVKVQIVATLRVTCERTIDTDEFDRIAALRDARGFNFRDEVDDLISRGEYDLEVEDVETFELAEDGDESEEE